MKLGKTYFSGSLTFDEGNNFIGPNTSVLTGSLSGSVKGTFEGSFAGDTLTNISGAFDAVSASIASDRLKNTTDTLTGDLTVTGTITAQEFHTEFVSASIIYKSGSTKFGDTSDDRHEFTGSTYLGRTYISDQVDVANNYSINFGSSRVHSSDTSYLMGGNVGINKTDPAALFDVEYKDTNHNLYRASDSSGMYRWRIDQFFNQYLTTAQGSDFIAFTNSGSYFNIGNVGIGSTSPIAALTVGTFTSTHHQNHSSLPTVPGNHLVNLTPPSTTNYYGGGISWSEGTNTAASLGVYDAGAGGALGMYFATGDNTTLTESMRLDSSGNLRVGPIASANDAKFKVEARSGGTVYAGLRVGYNSTSTNYYDGDTQYFRNGAGTTNKMIIDSSGNLTVLNATSTNSRTIGITNAAGTTGWTFGNGVIASSHQFVIYDNSAGQARMLIDSNGNVGIGVTSAGDRLHVRDSSTDSDVGIKIGNDSRDWILKLFGSDSDKFKIYTHDRNNVFVLNSNGDIDGPDRLYMRQTFMGYSSGYKVTQFGNSAATNIVSLGYNPSGNASGNFSGNEILVPNNVRILAPNAADNDFYGLMLLNSSNKLLIGSSNYLIDSNYIMLLDPATKNVNIGTPGPTSSGRVNIETDGSSQVGVGLRLINPYGFASAGTGVQIVFAQDRSESENFEMAVIRSSQSVGGTSDNGDLKFFTRGSGTVGERMRILASGGITFNGDSSSANALDDYEEGTYTPTVYTTSGTPTYQYQEGYYTKIGRQVFGGGIIGITNSSSLGGTIEVSLPFTSRSSTYGTAGVTFADGAGFTWPVTTTNNSYSVYNMQAVIYQNQPKFSCVTITPSAGYIGYGSSGVSSTWYFRFSFNYAV